jgi:hypothetical protein
MAAAIASPARPLVAAIETLCVNAIELAHADGEIAPRRLDQ